MQLDPQVFEGLRKSRWKLAISETGLGVPIQDALTRVAGASDILLGGSCPYSKDLQGIEADRAISYEAVKEVGLKMMGTISERYAELTDPKTSSMAVTPLDPDNLAVMVVSGCHRPPDYMQDTHASLFLITTAGFVYIHYRIPNSKSRDEAIDISGKVCEWVMKKALLQTTSYQPWLSNPPEGALIDVIDVGHAIEKGVDLMPLEAKLLLCTKDNPLVYHNGELQRVTDYLRRYGKLFRGSFDPPTQVHEHIGGADSIFEVSLTNARKGELSLKDAVHRAKMLDAIGVPTMFTKDCPLFADVVKLMQAQNNHPAAYLLGFDTFNAIMDPQFALPEEDWHLLRQEYFEVAGPDGFDLVENVHHLNVVRLELGGLYARSSEVREKIAAGQPVYEVHPDALKYIYAKRLYMPQREMKVELPTP